MVVMTAVSEMARTASVSQMQMEDGFVAPKSCQVLGDVFGFIVQGLLFGVVLATLLAKWRLETPRRELKVFILDSSKQIVGAGAIHCMNMVCAMLFAGEEKEHGDECAWYWVNIMIDTTFGVLICYGLLRATEKIFGYDSGHYGKKAETGIDWHTNPDYYLWGQQILVWCGIVSAMKFIVVIMMAAVPSFWVWLSIKATHWIKDTKLRLIFVMIITPTVMNIFQFCVTDTFLKYKDSAKEKVDV